MAQGSTPITPPFTSYTIRSGVSYVTDSHLLGCWIGVQFEGLGNSTTVYGNYLAVIGTTSNFFFRDLPLTVQPWYTVANFSVRKISGTISNQLWGLTLANGTLCRLNSDFSFSIPDFSINSITDIAVRDRVYTLTPTSLCSRGLIVFDSICATPPPDSLYITHLQTGPLWATRKPFTSTSTFFNTGFTGGPVTWLSAPADGNTPFVVLENGTFDGAFCASPGVNCLDPPSTATSSPTSTALPTATSNNTATITDNSNTTNNSGLTKDITVGIIVGACLALLIIVGAIVFACLWKRRQHKKHKEAPQSPPPPAPFLMSPPPPVTQPPVQPSPQPLAVPYPPVPLKHGKGDACLAPIFLQRLRLKSRYRREEFRLME
ncbi:hypothetical protein BC829DRAFT_421846 [Chytridium lagenaria]|nr:hypothetical protein BC829DRAFT_421846 [Chytridium lagenaria]